MDPDIKRFYENVYHVNLPERTSSTRHYKKLAEFLQIKPGESVLDIACGIGEWLKACEEKQAHVSGIDLALPAIELCQRSMTGDFHVGTAENLPFPSANYDVITCLGSMEHFVDPLAAIREMIRVAKSEARFVILVPNADFLTRKLKLYSGTQQVDAKEDVKTLVEWNNLFEMGGLKVVKRWRDLHVLSWQWILNAPLHRVPLRAIQALMLGIWPIKWQYQVYHLCKITSNPKN
jgi:SAM-dependent methyltransferase